MRKTGSRDPRESLEASVTSPFSIAVNTFSMRFGSRRNQRPPHQKIRSITTVSPMIDTIKIGHMIGPPLWNLSINQLLPSTPPLGCASAAGGGLAAAGLNVAVTAAAGAAGPTTAGGAPAGDVWAAPGAAGDCASEVSASASEDRQTMSEVFIVEAVSCEQVDLVASFRLLKMNELRVEKKFSLFCDPRYPLHITPFSS